jgi:hypothetical protein
MASHDSSMPPDTSFPLHTPEDIASPIQYWSVLAQAPKRGKDVMVWCRCRCGTERAVRLKDMNKGKSRSCGCLSAEKIRQRFSHGRHSPRGTREHNAWCGAKQRCYYPRHIEYHRYGGRGITMASEWRKDFYRFLADMGPCPPGYQLDRYPDPDGPYAPGNCRWASRHEQMSNQARNIIVVYDEKEWTLTSLARFLNLNYFRLHAYYRRRGYSLEEAIAIVQSRPSRRPSKLIP